LKKPEPKIARKSRQKRPKTRAAVALRLVGHLDDDSAHVKATLGTNHMGNDAIAAIGAIMGLFSLHMVMGSTLPRSGIGMFSFWNCHLKSPWGRIYACKSSPKSSFTSRIRNLGSKKTGVNCDLEPRKIGGRREIVKPQLN
jgi:hypothetical protein